MYRKLFLPNFIGIRHLYDKHEAKYIRTNVAVSRALRYFRDARVRELLLGHCCLRLASCVVSPQYYHFADC